MSVAAQAMNAASLRDYKRLMGVAGSKGDAHIDVHGSRWIAATKKDA